LAPIMLSALRERANSEDAASRRFRGGQPLVAGIPTSGGAAIMVADAMGRTGRLLAGYRRPNVNT
jgi:hypothetical protein